MLLALRGADVAFVAGPVILGLLTLGTLCAAFFLAQQKRLFSHAIKLLKRLDPGQSLLAIAGGAAALDDSIRDIYRHRPALLSSCGWRLVGWGTDVLEVWLALYILGYPVSFAEAFVLESLGQLVRAAGFAIPGAIGVQEGGYLALGLLLGIPGEVAIGLSLLKRVRDLALGLPALIFLKVTEGTALTRIVSGGRRDPGA